MQQTSANNGAASRRDQTLRQLQRMAINAGPVLEVLKAPEEDADALIEVLGRCPVLAARVIGVANSAGSTASVRMENLNRCVLHLGARKARTVALTMAMQLLAKQVEVDPELLSQVWGSAALKAAAARLAAEQIAEDATDAAYAVGLLQDIALPLLVSIDSDYVRNTLLTSGERSWTQLEREHFGIDHAELGALLLRQWNAPPTLVDAVRHHHDPIGTSEAESMPWAATAPGQIAGLLPHLGESLTQSQSLAFAAAHGRLLADAYDRPEDFINAARQRVRSLGDAKSNQAKLGPEFFQSLVSAVAQDTFALAAQATRLDHQLSQQTQQVAGLQEQAITDPLTGLLNRRGLDRFGRQVLAEAVGRPLACVVVDLDDFKPINDTHGHDAGDRVLKTAAELLKTSVNAGDLVARMGGDEFVIILVGAPHGDALAAVQRIHAICNGRRINVGGNAVVPLCMSIGGVHLPTVDRSVSVDNLLDAADRLMYQCKRTGKSCIEFRSLRQAA